MAATRAAERRAREHADRHERIIAAAQAIAEQDGWAAVTTRRLADAIEYSQPVLYGHFPGGKSQIMTAVALRGCVDLTRAMTPRKLATTDVGRIRAMIVGYLDYAATHPATYDAMFALPIEATFADAASEAELKAAFAAITAVLAARTEPPRDLETATELLWSSVHGLATLERNGRLRAAARRRRIDALATLFAG